MICLVDSSLQIISCWFHVNIKDIKQSRVSVTVTTSAALMRLKPAHTSHEEYETFTKKKTQTNEKCSYHQREETNVSVSVKEQEAAGPQTAPDKAENLS